MQQKTQEGGGEAVSHPPSPEEVNSAPMLDFKVMDNEPWITVHVANGAVIKVRAIVTGVRKIPGKRNPDGSSVYVIHSQTMIRVVENVKEMMK